MKKSEISPKYIVSAVSLAAICVSAYITRSVIRSRRESGRTAL